MIKKYELTDETLEWKGHTLHRIKALRDFGNVIKGDLGGWVESEDNLSHNDLCWVYNNAKVFGSANVFQKGQVLGHAQVFENACVYDEATVYHNAQVCGHANIFGHAQVCGDSSVCGHAWVYDNAHVCGHAMVCSDACVRGEAWVYDEAKVGGDAKVDGNAEIGRNAEVKKMGDYKVFKNTWSSGRWFTWTRSNNLWKVGCFYGTGEELIAKAYKDSELSGKCYEAIVQVQKRISELLK